MKESEAWIRHEGFSPPGLRDELERRLSSMGVVLRAGPASPAAPGIVVFGKLTDDLIASISRWKSEGFSRLLLLATSRTALQGEATWRLVSAGASEVLALDELDNPPEIIGSRIRRWIDIEQVVDSDEVSGRLIGASPSWKAALRQVVELGLFTESPILVTGESGTGKELVAHLLHDLVGRRGGKGELVLVDCTTIVPDLSGSDFFGHERGAFTGAVTARDGLFARADEGTLFLDEVGELPLRLQAELLRVVQEGTYRRVGSNEWRKARFRLICATNRNLETSRAEGSFRDDFYHRLAGGICRLPSLEERREDIPLLATVFLRQFLGYDPPPIGPSVREFLLCRSYPGNVRELRQVVARLASRYVPPGPLTVSAIPERERPAAHPAGETPDHHLELGVRLALARGRGVEEIRQAASGIAYRIVLDEEAGSTTRAAERLKISTRAVQMYLRNRTAGPGAEGRNGGASTDSARPEAPDPSAFTEPSGASPFENQT